MLDVALLFFVGLLSGNGDEENDEYNRESSDDSRVEVLSGFLGVVDVVHEHD